MARRRRITYKALEEACRDLLLDDAQWHDSTLLGLGLETCQPNGQCTGRVSLDLDVYTSLEHGRRQRITVVCKGVREVVTSISYPQLADMHGDHITSARFNEAGGAYDFSIYLAGGYVRVVFDEYKVLRKRSGKVGRKTARRRRLTRSADVVGALIDERRDPSSDR